MKIDDNCEAEKENVIPHTSSHVHLKQLTNANARYSRKQRAVCTRRNRWIRLSRGEIVCKQQANCCTLLLLLTGNALDTENCSSKKHNERAIASVYKPTCLWPSTQQNIPACAERIRGKAGDERH